MLDQKTQGLPLRGSDGKESACSVGDLGSIPGLGRSPGEENGNLFRYSCLRIPWTEEPDRLQSMGSQVVLVTQLCLTHCDPMDCCLPGSSVHGILRQEYSCGLPFPSPGDLSNPGIEPWSPALQADSLPSELLGKPRTIHLKT